MTGRGTETRDVVGTFSLGPRVSSDVVFCRFYRVVIKDVALGNLPVLSYVFYGTTLKCDPVRPKFSGKIIVSVIRIVRY